MGKIHTHYDNLKVARLAPQEVIRAAYKALSQKYHPDKNPGDDKAARIMAILNSAYGTLSDPQRRKEHDEWIAAEEWEIAWLESTQQEEGRARRADGPAKAWNEDGAPAAPRRRVRPGNGRWWCALAGALALGWAGGMLMQSRELPLALAALAGGAHSTAGAGEGGARAEVAPAPKAEVRTEALIDSWAVGKPVLPEPAAAAPRPDIAVSAVSQVMLTLSEPASCGPDGAPLTAPNGEAWPQQSGLVAGFPVWNKGDSLELTVDNSTNGVPVFVKLYDLERRANVRYLYILAHDKLTVAQLAAGRYELRYQKIEAGGKDGCAAATQTARQ